MSTEIRRKYNLQDGILLAHIAKVAETLPEDLAVFEEDFPMVNQLFLDGLIADHTTALEEGGDEVARGRVGQKTQTLVREIERSKKIVKQFRFWVNVAFEDDPARRKSFNLTGYWRAAVSQPKVVQFMNALNKVATENSQMLIDAGMKQQLLDDLAANASALAEADAIQESSKGGRSQSTQARVNALNSLYERALLLDRVSDIIYEGDPAKRDFYQMPVTAPKADDLEEVYGDGT